ncbi:hypothetical protein V8E54_011009 [Elaphomyces granulatus]
MAFDELCKPIRERSEEWQPDTVANSSQTSILDWLQGTHIVDNGKESSKRKWASVEMESATPKRVLRSSTRVGLRNCRPRGQLGFMKNRTDSLVWVGTTYTCDRSAFSY